MRPINQTPQSADGAYERETIINFCDAEKTCSYYTRNYSRMNELRKLATEHPDEVKLTIDKEDCVEAEFPKKVGKNSSSYVHLGGTPSNPGRKRQETRSTIERKSGTQSRAGKGIRPIGFII